MGSFENRFWNLAQAAAWVVFRDRILVDDFEYPTPEVWSGLVMFPSMHQHIRVGSIEELQRALVDDLIVSQARRNVAGSEYEKVPAIEWLDLVILPPTAYRSDPKFGRIEPYSSFRFESKHLKKLWPIRKRPKKIEWYDWDTIKPVWEYVEREFADLTDRKKYERFCTEFAKRFDRKPPSRSSLQRHIKQWQLAREAD